MQRQSLHQRTQGRDQQPLLPIRPVGAFAQIAILEYQEAITRKLTDTISSITSSHPTGVRHDDQHQR